MIRAEDRLCYALIFLGGGSFNEGSASQGRAFAEGHGAFETECRNMIRNEREYQAMLERLEQDKLFIKTQEADLQSLGLSEEQVKRAMEPALSFHEQLKEEVAYYEKIRRGDFQAITRLPHIGRMLIALRIHRGMTQKELAGRLQVSEAQVSRDERNEYHGISLEKAQRVVEALGFSLISEVVDDQSVAKMPPERELALAY